MRLAVHKKYAPMHGNLALAKLAKGDLAGAAASARRAFTLSPSYPDAHRVQGLVYHRAAPAAARFPCDSHGREST
jgi:Flp pilus assembly protein TadD